MRHIFSGESRDQRVFNGCMDALRQGTGIGFNPAMSDRTLSFLRKCRPRKPLADLTDDEIEDLSENLRLYIYSASVDRGIIETGNDPKEFFVHDVEGEERPSREED